MNFPTQFCLGSICENFDCVESEKVQIKEIIYDFSVDFDAINKSEVLTIHEYLMDKNNIKYIWTYLKIVQYVIESQLIISYKCISLNKEPWLARSILIHFNLNELHSYTFMVILDRCDRSCSSLDDLSNRIDVRKETEDVSLFIYDKKYK